MNAATTPTTTSGAEIAWYAVATRSYHVVDDRAENITSWEAYDEYVTTDLHDLDPAALLADDADWDAFDWDDDGLGWTHDAGGLVTECRVCVVSDDLTPIT